LNPQCLQPEEPPFRSQKVGLPERAPEQELGLELRPGLVPGPVKESELEPEELERQTAIALACQPLLL
jgi:hypothetical protein